MTPAWPGSMCAACRSTERAGVPRAERAGCPALILTVDLNAGRNFYNDRQAEVRTTVNTHTVGGSFMGVGASHSRTGEATQRSAAEAALHTYERTAHLRELSRRAGNSK